MESIDEKIFSQPAAPETDYNQVTMVQRIQQQKAGRTRSGFLCLCLLFTMSAGAQRWEQQLQLAQEQFETNPNNAITLLLQVKSKITPDSSETYTMAVVCSYLATLYEATDFRKAESYHLQMRSILGSISNKSSTEYAIACNHLGIYYARSGKHEKAEPLYLEAREVLKRAANTKSLEFASTSNNLGTLYVRLERFTEALPFYMEALAIRRQLLGSDPEVAVTANNLAAVYLHTGKLAQADSLLAGALRILEPLQPIHPSYMQVLGSRAELLVLRGKNAEAEVLARKVGALIEQYQGKNTLAYAGYCVFAADLYCDMSHASEAETLLNDALSYFEKVYGQQNPNYINACNKLGKTYRLLDRYAEAETVYLKALRLSEERGDNKSIVYTTTCNNIGLLYQMQGRYLESEKYLLTAYRIRLRDKGAYNENTASAAGNLALLYHETHDFTKAEDLFRKSLEAYGKVEGKEGKGYAIQLLNLGALYRDMGQFSLAETMQLQSLELHKKIFGADNLTYASVCNVLGMLYSTRAPSKAEAFYRQASTILRAKAPKSGHLASVLNNIAQLLAANGKEEAAVRLYVEARVLFGELYGTKSLPFIQCSAALGELYRSSGLFEKARPMLEEALRIEEKEFGGRSRAFPVLCVSLARLHWAHKEMVKADYYYGLAFRNEYEKLRSMLAFTSEEERSTYLDKMQDLVNECISFYSREKKSENLFLIAMALRNLSLVSARELEAAILKAGNPELTSSYSNWQLQQKAVARLYNQPDPPLLLLRQLQDSLSALERRIARMSASFQTTRSLPDWEKIKEKLGADEAAIEFIEWNDQTVQMPTDSVYYAAVIVRKNEFRPIVVRLFERGRLTSLLKTKGSAEGFYRGIKTTKNEASDSSATRLLWNPLEKFLAGVRRIYYAPAGLLYNISLDALPLPQDSVLGDKYQFYRLTSTERLADSASWSLPQGSQVHLYGGINYDNAGRLSSKTSSPADVASTAVAKRGQAWDYLPGTLKEVNAIAALPSSKKFMVTISSGAKATEEDFKTLNQSRSPYILHLATHGFFLPQADTTSRVAGIVSTNPLLRCGLLLAGSNHYWKGIFAPGQEDGVLTAYEIAGMSLPNTQLAILSACETGLGEVKSSEGVFGLQRAFRKAGCPYLVMSLWKVPDQETAEFMEHFYQELFTGVDIYEAFHNTQAEMRRRYRKEPGKWAAWILTR
ncbi:MAG: tetratricopeptide repeat protein [Chitinophagaceae bacterium]|nr:MAG: tetratricopeptide repeat protein [Chitinophagaceae bacterium]